MNRHALGCGILLLGLLAFGGTPARTTAIDDKENGLLVGFGEADITPWIGDRPVYLAGFGQNRKATGVLDPLYARAVVFKDGERKIALVSVDLVGFSHPNVLQVRQQLAGFTYVLVSSTHNHEGPDTIGLWGPNPFTNGVDPDYLRLVERRIVDAVRAAEATVRPVRARLGTEKAPELLHDSRLPIVKHDELVTLSFTPVGANRLAGLIVQWNNHPETLDDKNTLVSADYVGATVEYLREKHGCPVVYLTGTVGGLMTSLKVEVKDTQGKSLEDGTVEKTVRYGRLVGEAADRALHAAGPVRLTPMTVRSREIFLPLHNKLYALARQTGVLDRQAYLWTGSLDKAEPVAAKVIDKPLCIKTEVAWLRLGELDIAAIPGEIYPELVLSKVQDPVDPGADYPEAAVEPGIYQQLRGPYRMIIGLANDEIGYIIPKRQWDEKPPFCYGLKKAQYGEINSLGPETAPLLCRAFQELVASGP